jgi:nitrogen regulatory protein PII
VDAARTGGESGDGLVWTTRIERAFHNRTGRALKEASSGDES